MFGTKRIADPLSIDTKNPLTCLKRLWRDDFENSFKDGGRF